MRFFALATGDPVNVLGDGNRYLSHDAYPHRRLHHDVRYHLFDRFTRLRKPARDLVIGQFQRLRACDGAVKLNGESRPVILQDRKLFFDIGALRGRFQTTLGRRLKLIQCNCKALQRMV